MGSAWGYLTRSSGLVATVLLVLALGWGLLFSARSTGNRRRPSWWLDLHNYLGGLAFGFILLHIGAAYGDTLSGIGIIQVFIPLTAAGQQWGITWGILSTYIFGVVVFTSWPKKRLSRRTWRIVHVLSIPATFLAATHAWMVGSDRHGLWFQALLALLAGLSVYPLLLRMAGVLAKRQERRERAAGPARPTIDPS